MKITKNQVLQHLHELRCELYNTIRNRDIFPIHEKQFQVDKVIRYFVIAEYCHLQFGAIFTLKNKKNTDDISFKEIIACLVKSLPCSILKGLFCGSQNNEPEIIYPASLLHRSLKKIHIVLSQYYDERPKDESIVGDYHQLCLANPLGGLNETLNRTSQVRHIQGSHYTPDEIVEYMTARTLDEAQLLFGLDNTVVYDPSCGCGKFLIYSLRHYAKTLHSLMNLSWTTLTTFCRKQIFGTDIDETAIEISKELILLELKCLSVKYFPEKVENVNIQKDDIHVVMKDYLLDIDDNFISMHNINVFLGGPPFVKYSITKQLYKNSMSVLKKRFLTARYGQFDLYMLFIEHSTLLLKTPGLIFFSLSNAFLHSENGKIIRSVISTESRIREIIEFEDHEIYTGASTRIALLFLSTCDGYKEGKTWTARYVYLPKASNSLDLLQKIYENVLLSSGNAREAFFSDKHFRKRQWELTPVHNLNYDKKKNIRFGDLPLSLYRGITTSCDSVFILRPNNVASLSNNIVQCKTRKGEIVNIERAVLRPIIRGRYVRGFITPESIIDHCIYPFNQFGLLLSEECIKIKYPLLYQYLLSCKQTLLSRKRTVEWYGYHSDKSNGSLPRIIASNITSIRKMTITCDINTILHSSVFAIKPTNTTLSMPLLLAFLNSSLFWEQIESIMQPAKSGYRKISFPLLKRIFVPRTVVSRDQLLEDECKQLLNKIRLCIKEQSRDGDKYIQELDLFVKHQVY